MDDLIEVQCCRKRIGMLPRTGAPVTVHTADCPRLDDIVMRAYLLGAEHPDTPEVPDQDLRDRLSALRRSWLDRALAQDQFAPAGRSVGLGEAARELLAVLETHGG